ncbi:MAG: RHS repeat domain-containing protein [Fibrobacterota bacterium]
MTPTRTLILAMATLFLDAIAVPYPSDLFLPVPDLSDSVSMRHPQEEASEMASMGLPMRTDWVVRRRDEAGRPRLTSQRSPGLALSDSITLEQEWNLALPKIGLYNKTNGASKSIQNNYSQGRLTSSDTVLNRWIPETRSLVFSGSPQDSVCRWMDSSVYDAENRLVYAISCTPSQGSSFLRTIRSIYQAWFEADSDSLPRRATLWTLYPTDAIHDDSILTVGPANRPDTVKRFGTSMPLFRDESGRLIKRIDGSDTITYEYDQKGRLTKEVYRSRSTTSTSDYLYSWNDPVGIRHQKSPRGEHIQLVSGGLRLNLPTPEHIRVERISLDGKRLALLADKFLPAGRSTVPIFVKPGDLVRIESSSNQTILVAPVR